MIKKNKNGLPLEVKYCKNCNLSNQQPTSTNEYFHTQDTIQQTIEFDANEFAPDVIFIRQNGIKLLTGRREKKNCQICVTSIEKNGEYDCIVGGSGGKDSIFQSHTAKYKYNMNPLTVTWSPHLYTDVGWKNLQIGYIKEVLTIISTHPMVKYIEN